MYTNIRPGQVWLDTNGNRIQAHGGAILAAGDTFYWYGENKEKTLPGSGIWHWGVRMYRSKDLYNWYVALADRWLTDLPKTLPDIAGVFDALFRAESPDDSKIKALTGLTVQNTSLADYVWLPVRFDGEMAYLDWHTEWRIEDYK
jgi:hypothetical protein